MHACIYETIMKLSLSSPNENTGSPTIVWLLCLLLRDKVSQRTMKLIGNLLIILSKQMLQKIFSREVFLSTVFSPLPAGLRRAFLTQVTQAQYTAETMLVQFCWIIFFLRYERNFFNLDQWLLYSSIQLLPMESKNPVLLFTLHG